MFDEVLKLVPPGSATQGMALQAGDRIVAIGDSITEDGGWLRAIQQVLSQHYADLNIPPIVNRGIGGQKAEDLIARFERDVIAAGPNVVTLSVGINDVWHRLGTPHDPNVLEAYERNVEAMVTKARDAGARVYLLTPTVIVEERDSEGNRRLAKYVDACRAVADRSEAVRVDLYRLFLEAIDRLASGEADVSFRRFTTDGVHMEPQGNVLMAIGVMRAFGIPDETLRATRLDDV